MVYVLDCSDTGVAFSISARTGFTFWEITNCPITTQTLKENLGGYATDSTLSAQSWCNRSESDMYSAAINEDYYAEAGVVSKGVSASCNWKGR